jgi:hypothetical protein
VHRRHPGQVPHAFLLTPGGESLDGFEVGAAGVRVAVAVLAVLIAAAQFVVMLLDRRRRYGLHVCSLCPCLRQDRARYSNFGYLGPPMLTSTENKYRIEIFLALTFR